MLTTLAAGALVTSTVGAIVVSSMRSARRGYTYVIRLLTCFSFLWIALDIAAWVRRDVTAALLLLASAAVLIGLGWQQSRRLHEDLSDAHRRHHQVRYAHDALWRRHGAASVPGQEVEPRD